LTDKKGIYAKVKFIHLLLILNIHFFVQYPFRVNLQII
jgi:hypothetical protein